MESLSDNSCRPTKAGKLAGVRAFMDSGTFGRIAKAGQRAILARAFADRDSNFRKRDWKVGIIGCGGRVEGSLADALEISLIMAMDPIPRVMELKPKGYRPVVIASDAMYEKGTARAQGGFLTVDFESNRKVGGY